MSVDGVHFPIPRQDAVGGSYYSHKFKGGGLTYEIAICMRSDDIVSFNGPFPAAKHDLTMFRSSLKTKLLPWEKVRGDKGYRGDPKVVINQWEDIQGQGVQWHHEHINKRMKQFNCLRQMFRHDLNKHQLCFKAVMTITQIHIEHGEYLYYRQFKYREW